LVRPSSRASSDRIARILAGVCSGTVSVATHRPSLDVTTCSRPAMVSPPERLRASIRKVSALATRTAGQS